MDISIVTNLYQLEHLHTQHGQKRTPIPSDVCPQTYFRLFGLVNKLG